MPEAPLFPPCARLGMILPWCGNSIRFIFSAPWRISASVGMQDIASWAQVVAVLVAAAAIYVSLRGVRHDLWLQMFTEYTKRYSDITSELAQGLRTKEGPFLKKLNEGEREKALGTMRRYFNLCSEEMYLFVNRKIDKKTWSIWSKGIEGAMARPFFAEAWAELKDDYQFFPDFIEFMDGITETGPVGNVPV